MKCGIIPVYHQKVLQCLPTETETRNAVTESFMKVFETMRFSDGHVIGSARKN